MKIKIIKYAERGNVTNKVSPMKNDQSHKTELRETAAVVKSWIDDLRQIRERERISLLELFGERRPT